VLAGALLNQNPTALFVGAGSLMVTLVLLSMFNPAVRAMEPGVAEIEPA
jgi:hypothetical protein